jgi:hypothetical protein
MSVFRFLPNEVELYRFHCWDVEGLLKKILLIKQSFYYIVYLENS